jgi:hypothetical protein
MKPPLKKRVIPALATTCGSGALAAIFVPSQSPLHRAGADHLRN